MTNKLNLRTYAMVFALIVIWVIFTVATNGTFLSNRNLSNLARQASVTAILAVGMVLVIVSANIDLSVGYGSGLLGAVAAVIHVWWGQSPFLSLLVAISLGVLLGCIQGYLVAYQGVPAFIVTLGGFLVYRGLTLAVTRGETIPLPSGSWFKAIGNAYLPKPIGWGLAAFGIAFSAYAFYRHRQSRIRYGFEVSAMPIFLLQLGGTWALIISFIAVMNSYEGVAVPVCILFALAFLFHFIANNTRFGRYVFAVGGNSEAAYLSGINVRKTTLSVFAIMGGLMGVAGVVLTARVGSAESKAGALLELDAIAACVIGGASLMGGRGSIPGAVLGALVMQSLNNGMELSNMGPAWQDMVKGLVLMAAVWFDIASRRRGR
jgi:D-xylose transport system permease protein